MKGCRQLLLITLLLCFLPLSLQAKSQSNTAALLDIKGAIGPAVQDFIHRGINTAVRQGDKVVILRMDTPGGLGKSMRSIIKSILASPIPIISYVSPSGARAASAGTYILYASHIAAMAPGTNLGAATPVSIGTPGTGKDKKKAKTKTAGQLKAINDARAYIRSLAQLRGRNVEWAEKAVSKAESLSAQEAVKLNVVNYIARDLSELLQKADGLKVSVVGHERVLHTKNLQVKQILPDWRTRFLAVITNPSIAYILLMVGFYGLFFEFANPGFVVPGVVGAICLLLALYSFQLLPINYAGLGLILLGLAFIVAEAFMPSFGALGIGGIISFVIGSILLLRTDVEGYGIPWGVILGVTAVTGLFFVLILQLAFRSRRRKVVSGREQLIGLTAVVIERNNKLWLRVEGELWKIDNSETLQVGQKVRVKGVRGLKLEVEVI